jgi:hypothetical protein
MRRLDSVWPLFKPGDGRLGRADAFGNFGLAQACACARGNPLADDGELGFQLSLPEARTEAMDQVVDLLLVGLDRNIGY